MVAPSNNCAIPGLYTIIKEYYRLESQNDQIHLFRIDGRELGTCGTVRLELALLAKRVQLHVTTFAAIHCPSLQCPPPPYHMPLTMS
ncbi:hypothetical protein BT63DRAFT_52738 [Microthyrium microscopicum]|uniref:Uncharacterized protein n=1 Tax=Microthyrium microscopicum TaxID=703497 RepID=A0A6A6U3N0_9PEZI|nr:hypothetical protein BT63DRAFT_52738 [Microthyrium microscopicum]